MNEQPYTRIVDPSTDLLSSDPDACVLARRKRWRVLFRIGFWFAMALSVLAGPGIAARLNPLSSESIAGEGDALMQQDKPEEAILAYERAVKADPNAMGIYLDLALAYQEAWFHGHGRPEQELLPYYEGMMRALRLARDADPENVHSAAAYAMATIDTARFNQPEDLDVAHDAWLFCLELQKREFQKYHKASRQYGQGASLLYLARIEMSRGNPSQARGYVTQAQVLLPGSAAAQKLLDLAIAAETRR